MNDTLVIFLCMLVAMLVITFCFGMSIALQSLLVLLVSASFAMGWLMGHENGTEENVVKIMTGESEN